MNSHEDNGVVNVETLVRSPGNFLGQEVTLSGLIVNGLHRTGYLVGRVVKPDKTNAIFIDDNGSAMSMVEEMVPPLGGGPTVYCEQCIIRGTFNVVNGAMVLSRITECRVFDDEGKLWFKQP